MLKKKEKRTLISVKIPRFMLFKIDEIIKRGLFRNRQELIYTAVVQFLKNERPIE